MPDIKQSGLSGQKNKYIGYVRGDYVVIDVEPYISGHYKYLCQCKYCNKNIYAYSSSLKIPAYCCRKPDIKSAKSEKDLILKKSVYIGNRYGKLTIIDLCIKYKYGYNSIVAIARCDCGEFFEQRLSAIKCGNTKSCTKCGRSNLEIGKKIHDSNLIDGSNILLAKNTLDCNRTLNKNNKTGVTGVSYLKKTNKYRAYITFKRKLYHLGLFDDLKSAINARKKAESTYYKKYLEENKKYPTSN